MRLCDLLEPLQVDDEHRLRRSDEEGDAFELVDAVSCRRGPISSGGVELDEMIVPKIG